MRSGSKGTKGRKKKNGRLEPAEFKARVRSDGQGLRYPRISAAIDDNLTLSIVDEKGRSLDKRSAFVREAAKIFREHVQELGGFNKITSKQKAELQIVILTTLIARSQLSEMAKSGEVNRFAVSQNNRNLLRALERVYA